MGFGFFLLVASLYQVTIGQMPSFVFAISMSFIAGLLAFFVPAGIGVREGVLVFLLSFWLPAPVAAAAAIMARVILAIGEAVAFIYAIRL
jgi:uncharacterized membrane protein YbhN (UPF0104 family)